MKNTKKIVSLILLSILLLGALSFTSFADEKATVNQDYSTISYDGYKYLAIDQGKVNALNFHSTKDSFPDIEFNLSTTQAKIIESYHISVYYNDDEIVDLMSVEYSFTNSMNIVLVTYIRSTHYNNFEKLYSAEGSNTAFITDIYGDMAEVNYSGLKGSNVFQFTAFDLNDYEFMYVSLANSTKDFSVDCGILIFDESTEKYFYLDYKENDIEPAMGVLAGYNSSSFTLHEVTDQNTLEDINNGFYNDDFYIDEDFESIFGNRNIISTIAISLSAIVFGLAPLVCSIICFVKSRKADAPYDSLLLAIAITCMIVAFFVALVLLFLLL